MNLKYINKIKANIQIYANNKTSNILDGTYKSVYKGNSMNFENLREYVVNDEIKNIDWKASSRSGSLLVKQFIAEKKHNIMLVIDSGKKMEGYTSDNELKKELALYMAGTIGYLAIKNGDYVGMVFNNNETTIYKQFKSSLFNLEQYLTEYEKKSNINEKEQLTDTLKYLCRNIKKRMIVFVITDLSGLEDVNNKLLRELTINHDVLFINISDAYMMGDSLYDLDEDDYIPKMFLNDKELTELEKEIKKKLFQKNKRKLRKNNISLVTINGIKEINIKTIELLRNHKYASNN